VSARSESQNLQNRRRKLKKNGFGKYVAVNREEKRKENKRQNNT
jgi:hypothetical protein